MGKVIEINKSNERSLRIQNIRFGKRKLVMADDEGLMHECMFIVLENTCNLKFKVTGYSMYFFKRLGNKRIETLDYHAKILVLFLNYIFFDNYEKYKMKNINELKIEHGNDFLRDYSRGKIGNENKSKTTVQKAEQVINNFYRFLYKNCEGMKFLTSKDFIVKSSNSLGFSRKNNNKESFENLFFVEYAKRRPPKRLKSMSINLFSEILQVCNIYYPELKLAICLQAFGGLRRGEVCNVTKDKIQYGFLGKEYSWFVIDLTEKTRMREDLVSVGNIKKRRLQPIHPIFLGIFTKVYNEHLELIKSRKNTYGALFLNRHDEAMTDESYEQKFERIIKLVIERLGNRGDFDSSSELNILVAASVNTHILRHFFTQFISKLETTRTPSEIAYWRGDSSLESALTYLRCSPVIDDKIKEIQGELLKGIDA
jgi:integrase